LQPLKARGWPVFTDLERCPWHIGQQQQQKSGTKTAGSGFHLWKMTREYRRPFSVQTTESPQHCLSKEQNLRNLGVSDLSPSPTLPGSQTGASPMGSGVRCYDSHWPAVWPVSLLTSPWGPKDFGSLELFSVQLLFLSLQPNWVRLRIFFIN
jgi:hypothetical protein